MKKIAFSCLFLLSCALSFAQVKVFPANNIPEKMQNTGGFFYALPTTTLKVEVSVVKVSEYEGYFADYSESLLGLTNVIKKNRVYFELSNVNISEIETADSENSYFVSCKKMSSLNDLFAENTASTYYDGNVRQYSSKKAELPDFFKNYADISYTQQSESFVDTKIIDGVVTQVPANHTKMVSKSFAQKAQQAADAIVKSRKDQYLLAAGEQETAYSGDALTVMLSEMKAWENNYMSLFAGVTLRDTITYVFYVTPENRESETFAFSINSSKGLSFVSSGTSDDYKFVFTPLYDVNKVAFAAKSDEQNFDFRYRNAVPTTVSLKSGNNKIHDFGVVNMFQFGKIQSFSASDKPQNVSKIGFVL